MKNALKTARFFMNRSGKFLFTLGGTMHLVGAGFHARPAWERAKHKKEKFLFLC